MQRAAAGSDPIFFAFEESPSQIIRNLRSIGIDFSQWVEKGLLKFHAERPYGLWLEAIWRPWKK